MSSSPAPAPSTASKEKGNAAFKAGDYALAIGHYTAAALADPSEPTFFLNRAAAYLKLSKNEDAERDCTTVLALSNKNVKALFRRAQARTALQKLGEAHNDLQKALRLEPNNEAVKAELACVDELIVNRKGKTRSAPIASPPPAASSSSSTAPPKRRRVPITIVDDDGHPPIVTQPTGDGNDVLLNPISSRRVSQTPSSPPPPPSPPFPDGKSTSIPPAAAVPKPPLTSFKEAKQVREAKSAGRVGGGIFRVSGKDTVFKMRDVPAPTVADSSKNPTQTPASTPAQALPLAHAVSAATRAPLAAPCTLFEFTRAWDSIPSSDTDARWGLLNSIHPMSLPALFGASLEPTLLASLIPVLADASSTDKDAVRTIMCSLTQVSRFKTVARFLSRVERNAARVVWDAVMRGTGNGSPEGTEEEDIEKAARMWGFTDA